MASRYVHYENANEKREHADNHLLDYCNVSTNCFFGVLYARAREVAAYTIAANFIVERTVAINRAELPVTIWCVDPLIAATDLSFIALTTPSSPHGMKGTCQWANQYNQYKEFRGVAIAQFHCLPFNCYQLPQFWYRPYKYPLTSGGADYAKLILSDTVIIHNWFCLIHWLCILDFLWFTDYT